MTYYTLTHDGEPVTEPRPIQSTALYGWKKQTARRLGVPIDDIGHITDDIAEVEECPVCGASGTEVCRTKAGNEAKKPHAERKF